MRHVIMPLMLSLMPLAARAEPPKIVTDIAPIGAIAARVLEGVGAPDVLLPPGNSPHDYAMRPSEARALAAADLVVWVGPALTGFLEGPVSALAQDAQVLTLMDGPVALLPVRKGEAFDEDGHDHDHDHDHGHADGEAMDPHLWLDPGNAVVIAGMIADAAASRDPENASRYRANVIAFTREIDALSVEVSDILAPVSGLRFIVLHDAFHYFEARFGIEAAGAVMPGDGDSPGAARLSHLRARLAEDPVICAFAEPQMNTALIETAVEGQGVRIATLDPIGSGDAGYAALIRAIAQTMAACLSPR